MSEILSREEFERWADMEGHAEPLVVATIESLAAMLSWVDPSPIDGESPANEMDELEEKGWLS